MRLDQALGLVVTDGRSRGGGLTQAAYDAAVAGGCLWHELGDSALLLRR